MDLKETARMFKALGDPTRLHIFQFLRSCCCATVGEDGEMTAFEGPTITEVCGHVTGDRKITTTMSFHLKELRIAGLIDTQKRGKNVCCCINRQALDSMAAFLGENEQNSCNCC